MGNPSELRHTALGYAYTCDSALRAADALGRQLRADAPWLDRVGALPAGFSGELAGQAEAVREAAGAAPAGDVERTVEDLGIAGVLREAEDALDEARERVFEHFDNDERFVARAVGRLAALSALPDDPRRLAGALGDAESVLGSAHVDPDTAAARAVGETRRRLEAARRNLVRVLDDDRPLPPALGEEARRFLRAKGRLISAVRRATRAARAAAKLARGEPRARRYDLDAFGLSGPRLFTTLSVQTGWLFVAFDGDSRAVLLDGSPWPGGLTNEHFVVDPATYDVSLNAGAGGSLDFAPASHPSVRVRRGDWIELSFSKR